MDPPVGCGGGRMRGGSGPANGRPGYLLSFLWHSVHFTGTTLPAAASLM
jgi:hypothetical protein